MAPLSLAVGAGPGRQLRGPHISDHWVWERGDGSILMPLAL